MIGIRALAGEEVDVEADSEGNLERGAHDLWRRTGPQSGNLLGQHALLARQPLPLFSHSLQLALELLQ
jgi:hypothetical protein